MTNAKLQKILEDLYTIDPELRAHEADLIPLISTLIATKRDPKPTKEFAEELKRRLHEYAAAPKPNMGDMLAGFFQSKSAFALLGAFVGVAVAGPAIMLAIRGGSLPAMPTQGAAEEGTALLGYQIDDAAPNAFGPLNMPVANQQMARTQSGGGGLGGGGVDAAMDPKISSLMLPPGPIHLFKYEYTGDDITLPEGDSVNVLRRRPVSLSSASVDLPRIDVIDVNSFPRSEVTNLTLSQNTKNGYMLTLDLKEGMVSLYQNWEQWDDPYRSCSGDPDCVNRLQLSPSDIPADSAVIQIADKFLQQHGVDMSQYGDPEVNANWRVMYDSTPAEHRNGMVPDTLEVLYPLMIENEPVYEQYGGKMGISVSVNIRHKAVSGAWNILIHQYDQSAYPAVQSSDDIMAFLQNLNSSNTMPALEEGMETEEASIKLGTPTQILARYYRTTENGASEQLLVPALLFPISSTENTPEYYSPSPVIVPLASELLEQEAPGIAVPLMMR